MNSKIIYLFMISVLIISVSSVKSLSGAASLPDKTGDHFQYQDDDDFEGNVPTAGEFFEIPLGQRFTPHRDVMD